MNRMIDDLNLSPPDQKIAAEYMIQAYKNSDKVIRDQAKDAIVKLYQIMGGKLRNLLSDVRKPQMEVLEDEFNQIDGIDPNTQPEAPASEPTVVTNINPSGAKKKNKPKSQKKTDPNKTCEHCGKFDPNFDQDSLDMHQFEECAMLTECPQCGLLTEIPELNFHMLEICENKNQSSQCPRCKESIHIDEYDDHVDQENCKRAANPSKASRCPLCHDDIQPGDDGWKQHLLVDTCPNNQRHP